MTAVQPLQNLEELEIGFANITDNDLKSLARHPQLHKLTLMECNQITDTGVRSLAKIKSLKELSARGCEQVTKATVEQLQTDLPECRIEYSKY